MNNGHLKLGIPVAGWLPIEFTLGEFQLSCEASDLGLNVIDQLADVFVAIENGQPTQCYFYLEPSAYIFNIERLDDTAFIHIQLVDDFNHQDLSPRETVYEGDVDILSFKTSIKNALADVQQFEYDTDDWPIPKNLELINRIVNS